jgi:hypothetical protein
MALNSAASPILTLFPGLQSGKAEVLNVARKNPYLFWFKPTNLKISMNM